MEMDHPSLLISFNAVTWDPTAVYLAGRDETQTEKLQEIAEKMLRSIKNRKQRKKPAGKHAV